MKKSHERRPGGDTKARAHARTGATTELVVDSLANGGDGVAFALESGERRAVFLPRVAPGDRVEAEVDFSRRPARARAVRILEAGPGRAVPPCAFLHRCGACNFMHLTPATQAAAHLAFVLDALGPYADGVDVRHHTPGRAAARIDGNHATGADRSGRTRARLHVAVRGGKAEVGMYRVGTHELAVVDACVVLDPELDRFRVELAELFRGERGRGDASVALGGFIGGRRAVVLDLVWDGELTAGFYARLEERLVLRPGRVAFGGARITTPGSTRTAAVGDPRPHVQGFDGELLELGPGGFAQASDEGNAMFANLVADAAALAVGSRKAPKLVELYAGAGNLTVAIAARLGTDAAITSVESDPLATAAAPANIARSAARTKGAAIKVVTADAATYDVGRADVVVLDPPRTGARSACEQLAKKTVRGIVYASCDPPTLGRDLAILAGAGYGVRSIDLLELFPDTSHVETIVRLAHPLREKA